MTNITVGNVKYNIFGNYYIVGDNSTKDADGITDTSYSGEIEIKEKINGIKVLEIAQYAFTSCINIKKVYIYAKLRSINKRAFCYCTGLEYLNIPDTVTNIGEATLYFGDPHGVLIDSSIIVEFNPRKRRGFFIDENCFSCRTTVYIIYQSNVKPSYFNINNNAFNHVINYYICAPSVFEFYTKTTTTDLSQCPLPIFRTPKNACTCYSNMRQNHFLLSSFLIYCMKSS